MVPLSEFELIQKIKNGDLQAFEQIYRNHSRRVYGFCLRLLNHKEDAEDVSQTIFLKLYRSINQFKYKASLRTYIMSITRNACYDKLNQRQRHQADELKEEEMAKTSTPLYEHQDIETAIASLPVRMRECFILFAVEGYPLEEIGKIMDVQLGTVKAMTFQARKKIREMLEEPGGSLNELL